MEEYGKYLIIAFPAALGGLIMYARKKEMVWTLIGVITGLIIGLLMYYIYTLPWYAKLLGGFAGGLGIYFLAPTIATVIVIFMSRKR
jgi:uncharacterized membrane protein (UPF0136 family)